MYPLSAPYSPPNGSKGWVKAIVSARDSKQKERTSRPASPDDQVIISGNVMRISSAPYTVG